MDCAHGATYHIAPRVFEELGAQVHVIGGTPNGTNINAACGSTHPDNLAAAVREQRADVGIAFDGDGDRVIMVDADGVVVDGDELLYIIARHRLDNGRLAGGVVGTQMSNYGLERAFAELKVPFERAKVGDRYVLEQLRQRTWELGGETSGHLLCLDLTTTGDAIVAALQALVPMVESGAALADLKQGMHKLPQVMLNLTVPKPRQLAEDSRVVEAVRNTSTLLAGRGRVLVRPSGTEPVLRVMVEGADTAEVQRLADELAVEIQDCA